MEYYASLILVVAGAVTASFLIRPKEHTATRLEKVSKVLTVTAVLILLYIPMSIFSVFTAALANDFGYIFHGVTKTIWNSASYCAVFMPHISVLSVFASVALGKRGRIIFSFVIQFFPLILFILLEATLVLIQSTVVIP